MTDKNRHRSPLLTGVALSLVTSLLVACGSEPNPTPPAVEETVFRDMAGAVDKARAVEGTIQQHKEGLERALEQNENPTAE